MSTSCGEPITNWPLNPSNPVVLFDNVDEPLITNLAGTLHDWTDGL
ncbi:hypothetical protein ACFW93_34380 [Streptomyces canus]